MFHGDNDKLWHGINLVSLIRRGVRDTRIPPEASQDAGFVAGNILDILDKREARARNKQSVRGDGSSAEDSAQLDVWDVATRIEAQLALERYDAASRSLDAYLVHPDMHAFEVSSTYRQFEEVLQLGGNPLANELMTRLWGAVICHRAGGALVPSPAVAGAEPAGAATPPARRPLIVRISDPEWKASNIPDLEVTSRLGTIVSITGTERSIKALLMDPLVVSVDESRQSDLRDCKRSRPFIRVTDPFTTVTGTTFTEKGAGALVAVIDNGIDVLHRAFLDANGDSRIIGIWDQQDDTGPPPAGFTVAPTAHAGIAKMHERQQGPPGRGVITCQRRSSVAIRMATARITSIAAGGASEIAGSGPRHTCCSVIPSRESSRLGAPWTR